MVRNKTKDKNKEFSNTSEINITYEIINYLKKVILIKFKQIILDFICLIFIFQKQGFNMIQFYSTFFTLFSRR